MESENQNLANKICAKKEEVCQKKSAERNKKAELSVPTIGNDDNVDTSNGEEHFPSQNENKTQVAVPKTKRKKKRTIYVNDFDTKYYTYGGYYGYDNEDGDEFIQLGKEICIDSVVYSLESNEVVYNLSFEYRGEMVKVEFDRGKIFDPREIIKLTAYGADIPNKNVNAVIDTLRKAEQRAPSIHIHNSLGWHESKDFPDGIAFKSSILIGGNVKSHYVGDTNVNCKGSFKEWRKLIKDEVIGHIELETLLVSALSSVIIGLTSEQTTKENPIISFSACSGSGKTTVACLMASVGGKPFHGCEKNSEDKSQTSLLQSWSSTSNAILAAQAGNNGYPIIIDELSKIGSKADLSDTVYSLSEGTQKKRMNSNTEISVLPSFHTTIISLGECSLLSKCKNQNLGLKVRVLELSGNLTTDAEHSRRIKQGFTENYGFAIPVLAKFIIENYNRQAVVDLFNRNVGYIKGFVPDFQEKDRIIEKFLCPLLTTAQIAGEAFNVKFSFKKMLMYLIKCISATFIESNPFQKAYDDVLEYCVANKHHFYDDNDSIRKNIERWGTYYQVDYSIANGDQVVGEYAVFQKSFESIIEYLGYENPKTIFRKWKDSDYISTDSDRLTRKRKMTDTGKSMTVYVLRVFKAPEEEIHTSIPDEYFTERKTILSPVGDQFPVNSAEEVLS